jgi:hypothetical protein
MVAARAANMAKQKMSGRDGRGDGPRTQIDAQRNPEMGRAYLFPLSEIDE